MNETVPATNAAASPAKTGTTTPKSKKLSSHPSACTSIGKWNARLPAAQTASRSAAHLPHFHARPASTTDTTANGAVNASGAAFP